jgi:hypothetical protein
MLNFSQLYSQYYDLLYADKDYAGEFRYVFDLIQSIIGAIEKIKEDYEFFMRNSVKAGIEFDYAKMFNENKEKIFGHLNREFSL